MSSTLNKSFDIRQTNISKGIACMLLLFHHVFYNSPNVYKFITPIISTNDGIPIVCKLAPICKICVAMFLILSGYGMNVVFKKAIVNNTYSFKSGVKISLRQLWKLWANYIFVFVLFVPWQHLFDHMPYNNIGDCIIDIFGLSLLFGTPTMNATWWYISIAILTYALSPLFMWVVSKDKIVAIVITILSFSLMCLGFSAFWCSYYFIGVIIGNTQLFERIHSYLVRKPTCCIIVSLLMLLSAIILRFTYPIVTDVVLVLSIIIISFLYLSRIKFISTFLLLIGKHSSNIFMFHTFIYLYDFKKFIYSFKYAPVIYCVLLVICLLVSILIEVIKKYCLVKKGIDQISNLIIKT